MARNSSEPLENEEWRRRQGLRVVFLDFDGVMNSGAWEHERQDAKYADWSKERRQFDPHAVKLLNELIERSVSKIVVSSSWRQGRTTRELAQWLWDVGIRGEVIGKTPNCGCGMPQTPHTAGDRGLEIAWWLEAHPGHVSSFVVLDDGKDMAHVADRLVWCDPDWGLRPNDVARAVTLLAGWRALLYDASGNRVGAVDVPDPWAELNVPPHLLNLGDRRGRIGAFRIMTEPDTNTRTALYKEVDHGG